MVYVAVVPLFEYNVPYGVQPACIINKVGFQFTTTLVSSGFPGINEHLANHMDIIDEPSLLGLLFVLRLGMQVPSLPPLCNGLKIHCLLIQNMLTESLQHICT